MPIQALISESGLVPARILLDHRQQMYTYRLLRLPNDHLTKNLLPISFCNGDEDTTREHEQPRDTLAWTKNEKPTSLGQWQTWQTSMANVIDPGYGVEPIKRSWRLNTNTCIQVIVQAKKEALQEATKTQAGITFWTDGSKLDTEDAGAAVVWFDRTLNKWQEKRRYLGENKDPFDAELCAISDALELSIKKTRNDNPSMITIFTNSRAAITKILDSKARTGSDAIRTLIYENAYKIKSSGHTLILRWVPSHSKIPVNEKTDVSAKDIAQKRGRHTDHLSSLTFIKSELRKTKLAELVLWHQIKSQEREATLQGSYFPIVKEGISPVLGKASKKLAMRFNQLKIGHGAVGTFLAGIGLIETPECW